MVTRTIKEIIINLKERSVLVFDAPISKPCTTCDNRLLIDTEKLLNLIVNYNLKRNSILYINFTMKYEIDVLYRAIEINYDIVHIKNGKHFEI
jgi:hypothetical protein